MVQYQVVYLESQEKYFYIDFIAFDLSKFN